MVWYPLGRPVGTTIYPGMQFTAVWIKKWIFPDNETDWTLNNVCVYIPTWFGVLATCIVGAITYEATLPVNSSGSLVQFLMDIVKGEKTNPVASSSSKRSRLHLPSPATECALFAMAMMAIVPAHLMRSMGGGYDNESIAVSAMVLTFYFWMRSLRAHDPYSHWFGICTGVAYFYMVATWGGYVFVLNMIGLHAAALVVMGRFCTKAWAAYSLFYAIGTVLAIQVPVVGWAPLKSLEQLGPCAVFLGYQLLYLCERIRLQRQLTRKQSWMLRVQVIAAASILFLVLAVALVPKGYFGPISARVRGLFVQHTKTGNPLVDSVAEHQPASSRAYFQYLHYVCVLAPIGYFYVWMAGLSDSSSFLVVWGTASYFFSHKMVRLILLTAPIGSAFAGIAAGRIFSWCISQWGEESSDGSGDDSAVQTLSKNGGGPAKRKKSKKGSTGGQSSFEGFDALNDAFQSALSSREGVVAKRVVSVLALFVGYTMMTSFHRYCLLLSQDLSNPSIILKARTREGEIIKVDDYREAYWWLRDNTPKDARVMAWWDYGYQIAAIANRTTIADGNTWNHEHIALLGKALTTDLDQGYEIARHLADYVLVWAGGGGDDLAKSPHLARIANSVYRDHCPDDPTCRAFGFLDRQGTPSAMMARSFLYRLHSHKIRPDVVVPADKFQEVYMSKYGKIRIFKILGIDEESKRWVADPANRLCDAPGSWFCPGQYPPGLSAILAKKKDFSQLEDFNKGNKDDEYTKKYFEHLRDPDSARRKALENEVLEQRKKQQQQLQSSMTEEEREEYKAKIDEIYRTWEDTEDTTRMWQLINSNMIDELNHWLEVEPHKAFIRSKDGRGPMFWAFEQRNEAMTKLLMKAGVPHTDKDAQGLTPVDLLEGRNQ